MSIYLCGPEISQFCVPLVVCPHLLEHDKPGQGVCRVMVIFSSVLDTLIHPLRVIHLNIVVGRGFPPLNGRDHPILSRCLCFWLPVLRWRLGRGG